MDREVVVPDYIDGIRVTSAYWDFFMATLSSLMC